MAPKKQHKQQQQPKQQQPHQQRSQQQQQQQQYPVPKWTDYNTFPPATEERVDQVFAWFTTRLLPLPNDQQLQYARAAAVHLARALQVHGMADAVAAVGGPEISEAVARVITHHLPAWSALSDLVDPTVPGMGTIEQWLSSAATLANQAGFTWRPSAPREDPAQQQQQQQQQHHQSESHKPAVIEVLDTDSTDDDFSPPPRGSEPSKPHASKSVAFDCDAPSRSRTASSHTSSRSRSLWHNIPSASTPRASSVPHGLSIEAQAMLALSRKAEDDEPIFSSHRPSVRDIFGPDEAHVLRDLPEFLLHKKEESVAELKRALQAVARFVIKFEVQTGAMIREHFSRELRLLDAGLDPSNASALHRSILLFDDTSLPRTVRLAAITDIALHSLRLDRHHHTAIQRLQIALLAPPPQSKEEAAAWQKPAKRNIVAAADVALPFRVGGF